MNLNKVDLLRMSFYAFFGLSPRCDKNGVERGIKTLLYSLTDG